MKRDNKTGQKGSSRRDFIKSTSAVAAATTLNIPTLVGAWAEGSDEIRVGVIGCGGRGTGAIGNVLDSAPGVRIVAMGDDATIFQIPKDVTEDQVLAVIEGAK
ncbi:MAG: twin-arginine translocation signal domain-containing protein [Acidobacteria bacterium]|nr:twin-arginine translocation signal domain-containing protein [Acidobacteriota bacterium]